MNDRDAAIALYHRYIAEVTASVPPERLLVFSVDQGWAPLCEFLNVPVPTTPFPNVNDRTAVKQTLRQLTRGTCVIVGLATAAVSGLGYLAVQLLS